MELNHIWIENNTKLCIWLPNWIVYNIKMNLSHKKFSFPMIFMNSIPIFEIKIFKSLN